ncbi:MAG: DUF192 domain-containing protein [Ilumatobacteraceae bacterium]
MRRLPILLLAVAGCGGNTSTAIPTTVPTAVSTTASATASATVSDTVVDSDHGAGGPAVQPGVFDRTAARITLADGSFCELCLWLAETPDDRARGLMEVTDLGAADAMAFVYPEAHTGSFWMKNTIMPLSIAFYSPSGAFLDAFDMEPCVTEQCTSYPTSPDFLIAVEAPQGGLDELGLVAGSSLELLDLPCPD